MLDGPLAVGQAVHADGHHLGGHQVARRGQLLAADDVLVSHAGKVDGRPLAAVDLLHGAIVVLKRAHPHPFSPRMPLQLIPHPHAAGRHRACHDGAMPLDDEGAVDGQPEPLRAAPLLHLLADLADGRLEFRNAGARVGGGLEQRGVLQEGAADEFADFQLHHLAGRLVHQVAFRKGDQAMAQAEQTEDLQVLAGLRHDGIIGRHDEQGQVDAGGAGEHVLDEALVAGHVHDAQAVGGQVEDGEADVDGDAASFLLRQAVAVDARQRLDQRGLAVVDVAGRAEDQVACHGCPLRQGMRPHCTHSSGSLVPARAVRSPPQACLGRGWGGPDRAESRLITGRGPLSESDRRGHEVKGASGCDDCGENA